MRIPVLVAGSGVAGVALGKLLARRGLPVVVLQRTDTAPPERRWAIVPAALGRTLPPGAMLEVGLPVDVLLPGGLRLETRARVSIVDVDSLLGAWRRHARTAGAAFHTVSAVRRAVRRNGGVAGVELEDGSTFEAAVTVDATGRGALLRSLFGAGLRAGSFDLAEREPVASTCTAADPRRIQASWAGRAQLLLGLDRPGAMAWRCVPRTGERVYAAATAGPGAMRSDSVQLLEQAVGCSEADASVVWRACRRPTDVITHDGLMSLGGAAASLDTLTGVSIPFILRAVEAGVGVLSERATIESPTHARLFHASSAFTRGAGADLAVRYAVRQFVNELRPREREAAVLSGGLGAALWHAAASADDLVPALALAPLKRSARGGDGPGEGLLRKCVALRKHYGRYPAAHDLFALDLWQARAEDLFSR